MTASLEELRQQLEARLALMRNLERALGDKSKRAAFIAEHGEAEGRQQYEQWRIRTRDRLRHESREYRDIKAQYQQALLAQPVMQLLFTVWSDLRRYPEAQPIREQIRLFVRDKYDIFFHDQDVLPGAEDTTVTR